MDDPVALLSPQLLEANRRLYELRAQTQLQRQAAGEVPRLQTDEHPPWEDLSVPVKDAASVADAGGTTWSREAAPAHLGWGSAALTAVIRRRGHQESDCVDNDQCWLAHLSEMAVARPISTDNAHPTFPNNPHSFDKLKIGSAIRTPSASPGPVPQTNDWVKLYPDIGLGMLRQGLPAPGRLWLALRYLDQEGCGLLRIDTVAKHLTSKTSALRLCGRRQFRNLLQDGEGVYWARDKETIWLRSAVKVASALGVERLTGQPVALPIAALLDGIGTFRAHLYAAFHSGRTKDTPHGTQARGGGAMPIARDTLAGLSGVGRSSQRAYEARVGLAVQANFAVGELSTKENQEKRAWKQGQALFELQDFRGQQGKKNKTYLAWQLPNSYTGQHQKRPLGRQKRINRKLKDLVMKGMPGNVGGTDETQKPEKMYFPNGKLAVKAYGRKSEHELYWKRHRTGNGRFAMWQGLGDG